MKAINWQMLIQYILIGIGVMVGISFSNQTNHQHSTVDHTKINHATLDIDENSIRPEIIALKLLEDSKSGWNLYIQTKNFQFMPEAVGSPHMVGHGHAHLMINGQKVARIYSHWFHIPPRSTPIKTLTVTLNANTHAVMCVNNTPISKCLSTIKTKPSASLPVCGSNADGNNESITGK